MVYSGRKKLLARFSGQLRKSHPLGKTLVLFFTYVFNVYDINGMVWYTQVELVLVISVLTRIFRYLNNKIGLIFKREKEPV